MPDAYPQDTTTLLSTLDVAIDQALRPLLPDGARCALLGFPNHDNVGDNAIWLGERAYLQRRDIDVRYASDIASHRHQDLARRLGKDGVILLHGGGNLGDVWEVQERFREEVIATFPGHRIIQLPQSIYFSREERFDRAAAVFAAHPDFTVLARDERSLGLAADLGATAVLCPDMAFALGRLDRGGSPTNDVLWLGRTDVEAAPRMAALERDGVAVTDWLVQPDDRLLRRCWSAARVRTRGLVHTAEQRDDLIGSLLRRSIPAAFDRLAHRRVRHGCDLLSRGRVVITDRLHGHIMCLLLGIPHVVLENSYGKITDFLAAFTGQCRLVRRAESASAALDVAQQLVDEQVRS